MANFEKKDKAGLGPMVFSLGAVMFLTAVAAPFDKKITVGDKKNKGVVANVVFSETETRTDRLVRESKAAFLKAYTVFTHPRCMNCHPKGDIPLQGDDSHLHGQGVQRGPEGKGVLALKCKNCHQDANLSGANLPPGSPHWQMPPMSRKMIFEGMSPKQLAIRFKDNQFTGFKKMEAIIEHVEQEPLVLNSFVPIDGREKLPMSHEEFVESVKEWIIKGAAIPDK